MNRKYLTCSNNKNKTQFITLPLFNLQLQISILERNPELPKYLQKNKHTVATPWEIRALFQLQRREITTIVIYILWRSPQQQTTTSTCSSRNSNSINMAFDLHQDDEVWSITFVIS
ncbi:hypothetical protein Cni_G23759 [Canna indica]|uniref:Uncharacterized protein n=1 Tax=Canna indica TaxID=4628 RepID=A0AAQ3KXT0_9LILI|nr:hypothetical protein Cni_G23759 [Canna indica]